MCHKWPILLPIVVLASGLVAGCGGGDDDSDSSAARGGDRSTTTEAEEPPEVATTPTTTAPVGNEVTGTFTAHVGGGQGYTVEISYDVRIRDVKIDLANAPPGQAFVLPQGTGTLKVTNSTAGRNTSFQAFYYPRMTLVWSEAEHGALFDPENCGFEFRGQTYCFGPRIWFGPMDLNHETSLAAGASLTLPVDNHAEGVSSHYDREVAEPSAEQLADLAAGDQPDLVFFGWESTLEESCSGNGSPLAILSGDGTPVLEGGNEGPFNTASCEDL